MGGKVGDLRQTQSRFGDGLDRLLHHLATVGMGPWVVAVVMGAIVCYARVLGTGHFLPTVTRVQ